MNDEVIEEFVCLRSSEFAVTMGLLPVEEVIEFLFGEAEVLVSIGGHVGMEELLGLLSGDRSTFILIMYFEKLLD